MHIPVFFIGFNRPDLARHVLSRLRIAVSTVFTLRLMDQEKEMNRDLELCLSMRSLINDVDWAGEKVVCERPRNLGCGCAVSEAISWFFQHVDRGIIIEDDCLPDPSFFSYCEENVDRYADDRRIWTVAGTSLIPLVPIRREISLFLKICRNLGKWPRGEEPGRITITIPSLAWQSGGTSFVTTGENAVEYRYWVHILEMMFQGKIDTWDFQVQFSALKENALHVTSSRTLSRIWDFEAMPLIPRGALHWLGGKQCRIRRPESTMRQ